MPFLACQKRIPHPVRAAAGAAAVPPGCAAARPSRLPGRRPRAGRRERHGGRGAAPGRPARSVRRGVEGGGHRVGHHRPPGVRGGERAPEV